MSNEVENKSEVKSENKVANEHASTGLWHTFVSWWKSTCQFLHEVWVEVRPKNGRVSWPTWESVKVSTKVVIASSLFLGLFIGLLDMLFARIYSAIVNNGGNGIG